MMTPTLRSRVDGGVEWVLPSGHLGDGLLLSAVLRAGHARTGRKVGIVRSPAFTALFLGHPAVTQIAVPGADETKVLRTDYWNVPFAGALAEARPWAKLAAMIFREDLPEEPPWAPLGADDGRALGDLPLRGSPLLVAPASDCARKQWPEAHWAELVARLEERVPVTVAQVGPYASPPIPGCVNVSGLLRPRALLALVARAQGCVSVDPFVTAAAAMAGIPTVALYGPTLPALEGFDGQVAVHRLAGCEQPCLVGAERFGTASPCPKERHCMAEIPVAAVLEAAEAHVLTKVVPDRAL